MPRGKDWTKEQDQTYKDKLRSGSHRLPDKVAEGLENLGKQLRLHTDPGATQAAPSSSTPVPEGATYNRSKISNKEDIKHVLSFEDSDTNSGSEEDQTVLFSSSVEDQTSFDSSLNESNLTFVFSTPSAKMADQEKLDEMRNHIARLEKAQSDHQREVDHLKEVVDTNTIHWQTKNAKLKKELEQSNGELQSTRDSLDNKIASSWEGPVGNIENQLGDLVDRINNFARKEDKFEDKFNRKEESLDYRKHTDAIRHLGRKVEVFEKPTICRSAKDFIDEYIAYAKTIHSDDTYYFDGISQYLKGEAKNYFDSYRAVREKKDHEIITFRGLFLDRFKRIALDEIKKGASQRKQKTDESVRDYGVEMQRLMGRMKVDEEFKLEFLITNMLPSLQEPVLAAYPSTVEEALVEAEKQEAIMRSLTKIREVERETASGEKSKQDLSGLLEKVALQEAQLNAIQHKNRNVDFKDRPRNDDRSRTYDRRSDRNSYDKQKFRQNDHRSGSGTSRSGDSKSKSPGRRYDASFSRERYEGGSNRSGDRNRSKSNERNDRSSSRDKYKKSGDRNYKSSGNYKNSKSHRGNDRSNRSYDSGREGSTLDTLPPSGKNKEYLNN